MTYCVAVMANDGLVFCSDSRTNAGPDVLSSYSKMHVFRPGADRVFCLLCAGNLATTQAIVTRIKSDLQATKKPNLGNCASIIDAARYIAGVNREEQAAAQKVAEGSGIDISASLIFGGQIRGGEHAVYLMYPAGNFIAAAEGTTHLQIGESKYGKPILDRILTIDTSLEDAARCAIVSMDSTIKSNATVGPPIEVLVYEKDSLETDHYIKMEDDDEYLRAIKTAWDEQMKQAFSALPYFEWEKRIYQPAQATPWTTPQQTAGQAEPGQFQHPVQVDVLPGGDGPLQSS